MKINYKAVVIALVLTYFAVESFRFILAFRVILAHRWLGEMLLVLAVIIASFLIIYILADEFFRGSFK